MDGSAKETVEVITWFTDVCSSSKVAWIENPTYRNPAVARNVASKMAVGDILVQQSDDVMYANPWVLEKLVTGFDPTTHFHLCEVWNQLPNGKIHECYVGRKNPRPLFFLGAVSRKIFYEIGGNCEEFTRPGFEDLWLGDCLMKRLRPKYPRFGSGIFAYHQDHPRPDLREDFRLMKALYERKKSAATNVAAYIGGPPWPLLT